MRPGDRSLATPDLRYHEGLSNIAVVTITSTFSHSEQSVSVPVYAKQDV